MVGFWCLRHLIGFGFRGQDLENKDERLVQVPGKVDRKMFGFGILPRLDLRVIIITNMAQLELHI